MTLYNMFNSTHDNHLEITVRHVQFVKYIALKHPINGERSLVHVSNCFVYLQMVRNWDVSREIWGTPTCQHILYNNGKAGEFIMASSNWTNVKRCVN